MDLALSLLSNLSVTQVLIIVAVAIWAWKFFMRKSYRLPPGPFALPLLGNILEFKKATAIEKFNEWGKKFGPVSTFYLGPKRVVVLNSHDIVNEAFATQGADFSGRPCLYSTTIVSEGNKDIVFASYGELWKYQRRVAAHSLRQYLTGSQLEHRVHETLQQIIQVLLSETGTFNPHKCLNLSVFNIIHGLCFGKTMSYDDPVFAKLMNEFDVAAQQFGSGFAEDFIPPLRWWPTKRFRITVELMDEFNSYVRKQYEERRDNFKADNLNSLADHIVLTHQTLKDENPALAAQFTETHAVQIMADVFGAGVDTTRTTLDWFFLMMAAKPDVQQRIQKEIDDVVGNEIPGREHRSKLVYTEAALLETMRLHYVAPMGVPHETTQDTTLGGYEIPAQTIVVANIYGIMHDAKEWEEPLTFKPERFMNETEDKLIARHRGWFPFSLGHRSCLGESLAKLEMVYIVAGLLQVLTFALPPGAKPDFTNPNMSIINVPKPYEVIVTKRQKML